MKKRPWESESDMYAAMGMALAMVHSIRESRVAPGTDVNVVREGFADLIERTVRLEFDDAVWEAFADEVRKRRGLVT